MGNATPDPVYNLETAPNSFPSWQFIPPNSGPLPSNTKVITTNHTADTPMPETDIVTWLRSILHNDRSVELHCQQAADEIERLRKERDEARELFCDYIFHNGKHYRAEGSELVICASPEEIADDLGWDCFKDNTDG